MIRRSTDARTGDASNANWTRYAASAAVVLAAVLIGLVASGTVAATDANGTTLAAGTPADAAADVPADGPATSGLPGSTTIVVGAGVVSGVVITAGLFARDDD
jgi:hypothetical protein